MGWSMGERQTTDLVVAALVMALGAAQPDGELVHHADHGSQYTSLEFSNRLADWGLTGVLRQRRRLLRQRRHGIDLGHDQERDPPHLRDPGEHHPAELRTILFDYIETFYNRTTPPSPPRSPHPSRDLRCRQAA